MDITEYGMLRKSLENYSDNKFDAITTDMDYKGSVASVSDLPVSGTLGDVYTVSNTGARYVWDGTQWTQIESVASQLQEIIDAGNTQVTAIQTKGAETIASIPEDYSTLSADVAQIDATVFTEESGTEVVPYSEMTTYENGKFMNANGTLSSGGSHKVVSCPVGAITKISLTFLEGLMGGLALVVLKDSSENVVQAFNNVNGTLEYEFDIPSGYSDGTLYFNWFSYSAGTYCNQATITYNGKTVNFYTKTAVDNLLDQKANLRLFNGKNVYAFGDSICAGYTSGTTTTDKPFVKVFCDEVGANLTNYGYPSSCFASGYNEVATIVTKVESTNLSNADILLIAGGVNDCQLGVTETDFANALNGLMAWLKSNFDGTVIFVCPINFSRQFASQIKPLDVYRDYIKLYATINGFDVIDTTFYGFPTGSSATETHLAELLYGDGLHPTVLGHELYGKTLAKDLNVAVSI